MHKFQAEKGSCHVKPTLESMAHRMWDASIAILLVLIKTCIKLGHLYGFTNFGRFSFLHKRIPASIEALYRQPNLLLRMGMNSWLMDLYGLILVHIDMKIRLRIYYSHFCPRGDI